MPNTSTSVLEALLARVMEAERPDRYLDAAIWKALHPDLHDTNASDTAGWLTGGNHREPTKTPALSASLDACRALQEHVLPGWAWRIGTCCVSDDAWTVPDFNCPKHGARLLEQFGPVENGSIWDDGIDIDSRPSGNVPLAWLAAILTAVIAQSKEKANAGR